MASCDYFPPWSLRSGVVHTVFTAVGQKYFPSGHWQPDQEYLFQGFEGVPLHGEGRRNRGDRGTMIATYGITGDLTNQWFLDQLAATADAAGFSVIRFDWRGHGRSAALSPTLTSDGLKEGQDFLAIAKQAIALGYPKPLWCVGYSLGGQLALWGAWASQNDPDGVIAGAAVICPNLDSNRSLTYLVQTPWGRRIEQSISGQLRRLALQLHRYHPQEFDLGAIERATTIAGFDRELVIPRLGFATVADYYYASSPFRFLGQLTLPTYILYAANDPLFDPTIIADIQAAAQGNPQIDLVLTRHGGHVGYFSSRRCQRAWQDGDRHWGSHRLVDWLVRQSCSGAAAGDG